MAEPSPRVYIQNLPRSFDAQSLNELFTEAGKIAGECFVSSNRRLSGKFGFVEFADIATAKKAIELFHGRVLENQGREGGLTVQYANKQTPPAASAAAGAGAAPEKKKAEKKSKGAEKKSEKKPRKQAEKKAAPAKQAEAEPSPRVYIQNLPRSFETNDLNELFKEAGKIAGECFVSSNRRLSGKFGFVEFADTATAKKAIELFHGRVLENQGREGGLTVQYANKQTASESKARAKAEPADTTPAEPSSRVFVHNLPRTFNQEKLKELFTEAAPIPGECFVSANRRLSGKFGFVEFADVAGATKAIEMFNGREIEGQGRDGGLTVQYANKKNAAE